MRITDIYRKGDVIALDDFFEEFYPDLLFTPEWGNVPADLVRRIRDRATGRGIGSIMVIGWAPYPPRVITPLPEDGSHLSINALPDVHAATDGSGPPWHYFETFESAIQWCERHHQLERKD